MLPLLLFHGLSVARARSVFPIEPGDACWDKDFNYERCCIGIDESCWVFPHSRSLCCSAFPLLLSTPLWTLPLAAGQRPGQHLLGYEVLDTSLKACISRAGESRASEWEAEVPGAGALCHGIGRVLQFIGECPGIDVVLDLFLGGACSASALAFGLRRAKRRARPPEVFGFEFKPEVVKQTVSLQGLIGLGVSRGWWQHEVVEVLARTNGRPDSGMRSASDELPSGLGADLLVGFQARLLATAQLDEAPERVEASLPKMWVLSGSPYLSSVGDLYEWNALEVLCQHRGPLDAVVIDGLDAEPEWIIIEKVCRPKIVVLLNVNIVSAGGWISNRLEVAADEWTLTASGRVVLWEEPWGALTEVRRVRAWKIYVRSHQLFTARLSSSR